MVVWTPLKNMASSIGMMKFPIFLWKVIIQPCSSHHQPVLVSSSEIGLPHNHPSINGLSTINHLGLSENSVPHCTQWFCWSLSLWKMAISLGRLTQHFQVQTQISIISSFHIYIYIPLYPVISHYKPSSYWGTPWLLGYSIRESSSPGHVGTKTCSKCLGGTCASVVTTGITWRAAVRVTWGAGQRHEKMPGLTYMGH